MALEQKLITTNQGKQKIVHLAERSEMQQYIAECRACGLTYEKIAKETNLSIRSVKRLYYDWLDNHSKEWKQSKSRNVMALFQRFEQNVNRTAIKVEESIAKGDDAKFAAFQKLNQECLRDYEKFLRDSKLFEEEAISSAPEDEPVTQLISEYKKMLKERFKNAKQSVSTDNNIIVKS